MFNKYLRKGGVDMARPKISKEMKIKVLEKQLEDTKKLLNEAERRNQDMDTEIHRLQMVIAGMDQQQSDTVYQVNVIEQCIIAKENKKAVYPGRPKKITSEMIEAMLALHEKGYSIRKIAEGMNVSVGTVHRYLQM